MSSPSFFQRSDLTAALWTFRRQFVLVGLFSFMSNLLMLVPTIYMLQVFDRVMVGRSELTLLAISLITLVLFVMMAVAEKMRSKILVHAGLQFDDVLSTRVFNASFESHLNQAGVNPGQAFSDLIHIRQFLTGNGIFAFFDAPWAPIYIAVTFFLHPLLGVLAIIFALVQFALAWFGHRRTVQPAEAASRAGIELNAYLHGKLRNAEALESMGMIPNLHQRWRQRQQAWLAQSSHAQGLTHRVVALSKFIRYSQQSLALGAGALLVIEGALSPGGMIATNLLINRALAPIDQLVSTWRTFIGMRSAFLRLEKLLQEYPERDPALSRVAPAGSMDLINVIATAPGREQPILNGIDLVVPAGTVTVVLGPSGSGKSTLARVMLGIWPNVSGEVLLDGQPIDSWDRIELGPHLGYLPQDTELFEGSIAGNISRFGELDSAKIIEAAKRAGLHDMILHFPKGYDTSIGEAGGILSGGQRQRIGLARAVYGDPNFVVLDEPNSNLDDAGETALARTVHDLKQRGKTVFLITHRPSAIASADRLIIMRDGRIQIQGPRDEVLAALRPRQEHLTPGAGALQPA
jgi:ATP-binding cassette, subfamily C, bacterial exporter for protease/lipase